MMMLFLFDCLKASLRVPLISVILGEAGSGGALAIGMANRIAMLSKAYYTVISPEGAASILGRCVLFVSLFL
jgi:acetyl-CoA carboxylase carboxyl transferase subunit alpha